MNYRHIEINLQGRTVKSHGKSVPLRPLEFDLLVFLASNVGKAASRDEILDAVWGEDYSGIPRTVDNHISLLRSKLDLKPFLLTVHSVGYVAI